MTGAPYKQTSNKSATYIIIKHRWGHDNVLLFSCLHQLPVYYKNILPDDTILVAARFSATGEHRLDTSRRRERTVHMAVSSDGRVPEAIVNKTNMNVWLSADWYDIVAWYLLEFCVDLSLRWVSTMLTMWTVYPRSMWYWTPTTSIQSRAIIVRVNNYIKKTLYCWNSN